MKKLWKFAQLVLGARKHWSSPRRSTVLIFDSTQKELLLEDLSPWNPEVLDVGGSVINIPVLFSSLRRGGKRLDAYIDAFIEAVQPRLVVTWIDNRLDFYTVSERHPGVKTLFIQNGYRSYYCDIFEVLSGLDPSRLAANRVDYMLTFGSVVGAEYSKYIKGECIPIGSLKCNRATLSYAKRAGVLAYVSQGYHPHGYMIAGKPVSGDDYFRRTDATVLSCLDQYASRTGRRLMIVPRNRDSDERRAAEESYFRELLGREAEFLEGSGSRAGYEAVDAAEVVVAIDSTLAYESIARGNRTAIFSIRGNLAGVPKLTYGWPGAFPDDGPFWTNRPDTEAFVRILDHLFDADDAQWRHDLETTNFSSLLTFDAGNGILKSLLVKELGSPDTTQQIPHLTSSLPISTKHV